MYVALCAKELLLSLLKSFFLVIFQQMIAVRFLCRIEQVLQTREELDPVCQVPLITSSREEQQLLVSTSKVRMCSFVLVLIINITIFVIISFMVYNVTIFCS